MYLEHNWLLTDNETVNATAVSTNVIDVTTFRDLGMGTPLYLNFLVTSSFTGGGSLSVSAGWGTNTALGSFVAVSTSAVFDAAQLTVGSQISIPITRWQYGKVNTPFADPTQATLLQGASKYFGAKYNVTSTLSGKITARLSLDQSSMMSTDYYPASTDT